jgi:hypothetical protein
LNKLANFGVASTWKGVEVVTVGLITCTCRYETISTQSLLHIVIVLYGKFVFNSSIFTMYYILFSSLFLGAASSALIGREPSTRTMIPKTCFDSVANFDVDFDYLYPWGSDHNGAARMDKDHIKISDGVLTLTASPVTGQNPASQGGKSIAIH